MLRHFSRLRCQTLLRLMARHSPFPNSVVRRLVASQVAFRITCLRLRSAAPRFCHEDHDQYIRVH